MNKKRKIFFVVAGGGYATEKHYFDTIRTKRTIDEVSKFLPSNEVEQLNSYVHGNSFAVWGALPGSGNMRTWENMEAGDYVMVCRSGRIIMAAEVAMKVRNKDLAKFFWQEDEQGITWELVYFLINDIKVDVKQSLLNKYFGYSENYFPRGFMAIEQEKVDKLLSTYGDLISLLKKLQSGGKLEKIDVKQEKYFGDLVEEKIKEAPTEHDEMQWRLINLGNKARFGVWIPITDQRKTYQGNTFKKFVLNEFHETLDVPIYIKNIDTVWKLGLSIKAAFEIEHTTSIYSGILRLSDLRALAPNSSYPLVIVADRDRRTKVFEQLRRPTFSNEYINLHKVARFLSYDNVREIDENIKKKNTRFDIDWLVKKAERLN